MNQSLFHILCLLIYLLVHSFILILILTFFTPLYFFPLCSVVVSSSFSSLVLCFFLLPSFLYLLLCGSNSFSCRLFLYCFFNGLFLVSLPPFFLHLSFDFFLISCCICLIRLISFFAVLLLRFFHSLFRSLFLVPFLYVLLLLSLLRFLPSVSLFVPPLLSSCLFLGFPTSFFIFSILSVFVRPFLS